MLDQIISVIDSNTGLEKDYEILYTFSSDIFNHEYIVMYEKEYTEDEVELHIVIYKDNELYSIEDEKEWEYAYNTVSEYIKNVIEK